MHLLTQIKESEDEAGSNKCLNVASIVFDKAKKEAASITPTILVPTIGEGTFSNDHDSDNDSVDSQISAINVP